MAKDTLKGVRVAILVSNDFEQVELTSPKRALEDVGAQVQIVSSVPGELRGMEHDRLADSFKADLNLDVADPQDFDVLVLPGGALNADQLRMVEKAQEFIKAFNDQGKPMAVICHAAWVLVSAGLVRDRELTSWPTIQDDIRNAGGHWRDQSVVRDKNWITSRGPKDLPDFNEAVIKLIEEISVRPKEMAGTSGIVV